MYDYKAGDELEVRLFIDSRNTGRPQGCAAAEWMEWKDSYLTRIMQHVGEMKSVSQYVDVLVSGDGRYQREFCPVKGGQIKGSATWTEKQHIASKIIANESGGLRVSHARERVTPGESKQISNVSGVRVKVRGSKTFESLPGWRLDVTLVSATREVSGLKQITDKFVYPLAADGWIKNAPFGRESWIEFEFEYIGEAGRVTVDDALLYQMYELLLGWIPGTEYNKWLVWFARTIDTPMIDRFTVPGSIRLVHKYQFLVSKAKEVGIRKWRDMYNDHDAPMTVRQKVDGERQFICIADGKVTAVKGGAVIYNADIGIPKMPTGGVYVWDCEYMDGVWYILHPLVHDSQSVTHLSCGKRIATLSSIPFDGSAFRICPRVECDKAGFAKAVQEMWWTRKLTLDGLLITLDNRVGYWTETVVKWKPEPTFDFLVVKCPAQLDGKVPFVRANDGDTLYMLLVGCQDDSYYISNIVRPHLPHSPVHGYRPIPFSPADNPYVYVYSSQIEDLHGFICEFYYRERKWVFKKKRDDRMSIIQSGTDMGNNSAVAIATWQRVLNPFRLDDLYTSRMQQEVQFPTGIPKAKTLIMYNPPAGLVPPKGYQHMVSVGPNPVRDVRCFDEPGIGLPAEFASGAQLVVSFQIPTTNSARKWTKLMKSFVAAGGTLIHLPVGDGMDPGPDFTPRGAELALGPPVPPRLADECESKGDGLGLTTGLQDDTGEKKRGISTEVKLLAAGAHSEPIIPTENKLGMQGGDARSAESPWWYRHIAGTRAMTATQMHDENPHTVGNPGVCYTKYHRNKNIDTVPTDVTRNRLTAQVIPGRGVTLCFIEFLTTVESAQTVVCNMPKSDIAFLQDLFPGLQLAAYSSETKYDAPRALIGVFDVETAMRVGAQETYTGPFTPDPGCQTFRLPKCKTVHIPYCSDSDTSIMVWTTGKIVDFFTSHYSVWARDMKFFQLGYRQCCFKYDVPRELVEFKFDHCYDCKTEVYILAKYLKKHTGRTMAELVALL